MALADTANLVVQLRLDDKLSGGLGRVSSSLRGLQAGVGQMGRGVGQLGAGLARVGTLAATGFAVGVGAAVKAAGDFEASLNTINTLTKLQGPQLTALGEGIRQTFRDTGVPLDELTSGYYDLLSAGIKLTDAQNALNLSVKLGVAGLGTTQEAVNLVTTAINTFKLDQQGAAQAADIFAQTVADGVIKVSELQGAFADVAPIANTAGVSIKEIGASFAVLTAKGTLAAEAGTQLNRAILELYKPTGDLAKIQDKLGGSFRDLIRSKGLVQTLEDIRIEGAKTGLTFFDLFGRIEGAKAATNLTGAAFADFTTEMQRMDGAAGELNEQFAERQRGLNFQLAKLKAAAQDAGITIGDALIPKLVPLIEKLNAFIQANQGKIADFGQKLADGFASFADRIQGIDFSGVVNGLKLLNDIGGKVVDTFLRLPPNIQGLLVTGFALNKLSGGLLGKGAGNIAGGLIKLVFERGASPANPLWVASATGGIGGPGGGPVGRGLPLAVPVAAAAVVVAGTLLTSGSNMNADMQAKAAGNAARTPGATIKDVLASGATLGALYILAHDPTLNQGIAPKLLAEITRLADQLSPPLMDMATEIREGFPKLTSSFERSRATSADLTNYQRGEGARRAADAARTLDSLRQQTSSLQQIASQPTSFTAYVTNNITARLSVAQALATQTVVNSIRRDYRPGDSTGGSL